MEKMVTDPNVTKVLIICDKSYAEKADARKGGVGTESQIISTETYEKVDQTKFIPIIVEKDEHGKPYLPTFLKSRKYIDLSSEGSSDDFETLLRAIFNKPLHSKPTLGKAPSFITEDTPAIATSGKFLLFKDSIEKDRSSAKGNFIDLIDEAGDLILGEFIDVFKTPEPDQEIYDSILRMKTIRDHVAIAIILVCKFNKVDFLEEMFPFFEKCLTGFNYNKAGSYQNHQFDNIRFITHELFLTNIAILIKFDQIDCAKSFIERTYIYRKDVGDKENRHYDVFKKHLSSLDEVRNRRLGTDRLSLAYDLLKERADLKGIEFEKLMEVDLILWFRSFERGAHWFPGTLIFAGRWNPKLDLFLRAESKIYFDKIKTIFGVSSIEEFKKKFTDIKSNTDLSRWRFDRAWEALPIEGCLNVDKLATL